MRGFVLALAIALAVYATPAHADPLTLTFTVHISQVSGDPQAGLDVFGEKPEVGSTIRAVMLLDPQDREPDDPTVGVYLSPYPRDPFAFTDLLLTVGSSTTPVYGPGNLGVSNNVIPYQETVDRFDYSLPIGVTPTFAQTNVLLLGDLPASTFNSDAIPPPTALRSGLWFFLATTPFDYTGDLEEDTYAFYLGGPAQPVPEPTSVVLLGSGLAGMGAWLRRSRRC